VRHTLTFLISKLFCSICFLLFGQTFGFAQRLGDNPLQLAIGATELIRSPGLNSVHRLSVNAKDKTLGVLVSHRLMVQRSCVHYGLSRIIATEHYEQVAHHRSLLVVIELNDILI